MNYLNRINQILHNNIGKQFLKIFFDNPEIR